MKSSVSLRPNIARLTLTVVLCLASSQGAAAEGSLCLPVPASGPATSPPFLVEAREDVSGQFPGAPRVQSFAFAEHDGKWIFIAGRIGGFHGFTLPEEDFPRRDANASIWVVDPGAGGAAARSYGFPVASLPDDLGPVKDQWLSSNPLFYQDGDTLYIAGGYGKDSEGRMQTYPILSSVSLPDLVRGVMAGRDTFSKTITWVESPLVQSTGGEMLKLSDGLFYIVMGQVFTGRYSVFLKNGQQNTPEASQHYLGEIRKLAFERTGRRQLRVREVAVYRNRREFARRDLNVSHAILPDGRLGIGVYGGVFTPNPEQLNFVKPVYIGTDGPPEIDASVEQMMSSYECGRVVFYDPATGTNHTTFFGGISRWSFNDTINEFQENPRIGAPGLTVFSDGLPWIDTITTFSRSTVGGSTTSMECSQPAANRLPAYIGSEATFIPVPGLKRYRPNSEVFDLSDLPRGQRVHVGYLYGGIRATPFQPDGTPYNSGTVPTTVNDLILRVYITRP